MLPGKTKISLFLERYIPDEIRSFTTSNEGMTVFSGINLSFVNP